MGLFWLARGLAADPGGRRGLLVKRGEVWAQSSCWHVRTLETEGHHRGPGPELLARRSGDLTVPGFETLELFLVKFSEFMLFPQLGC